MGSRAGEETALVLVRELVFSVDLVDSKIVSLWNLALTCMHALTL